MSNPMAKLMQWYFGIAAPINSDIVGAVKAAILKAGIDPGTDIQVDPQKRSLVITVKGVEDWGIAWRNLSAELVSDFWTITLQQETPIEEVTPSIPWWHELKIKSDTQSGDKVRPIGTTATIYRGNGSVWKEAAAKDAQGNLTSWDVWGIDKSGGRIYVLLEKLPSFSGGLWVQPSQVMRV